MVLRGRSDRTPSRRRRRRRRIGVGATGSLTRLSNPAPGVRRVRGRSSVSGLWRAWSPRSERSTSRTEPRRGYDYELRGRSFVCTVGCRLFLCTSSAPASATSKKFTRHASRVAVGPCRHTAPSDVAPLISRARERIHRAGPSIVRPIIIPTPRARHLRRRSTPPSAQL